QHRRSLVRRLRPTAESALEYLSADPPAEFRTRPGVRCRSRSTTFPETALLRVRFQYQKEKYSQERCLTSPKAAIRFGAVLDSAERILCSRRSCTIRNK